VNDDDAQLLAHGRTLVDAVRAVLPDWVDRCVRERCEGAGVPVDDSIRDAARRAGASCAAEVGDELSELLALDPDDQRGTPLTVLRRAVRHPTEVLAEAGVPPVGRDDFTSRAFPDDPYDLTPASFDAIDPSLREPGITWGAARAHVHLRRHGDGQS